VSLVDEVPQGWILDLGCGSGLAAQMLLDRSANAGIFGVDSLSPGGAGVSVSGPPGWSGYLEWLEANGDRGMLIGRRPV
jgi:hypothetical protein